MKMSRPLAILAPALMITSLNTQSVSGEPQAANWRGQSVTEFTEEENEKFGWRVVNDGVMGGLSKGHLKFTSDGTAKFTGELSLENNGGFSMFQSDTVKFDLSSDLGLLLKVKGDGRTYQARLTSDATYQGKPVSFSGDFETTAGEWTQVKIPFSDFKGSWRGTDLPDATFDPSKIQQVAVLLGDKKQAPFNLEIEWIRTYGKGQGK